MEPTEKTKLLEQIEQWNSKDEYSRCIGSSKPYRSRREAIC